VGPSLVSTWANMQPGLDMQKQFGWVKELLPQPGPPTPPPTAPLATQLGFMLAGWKQTRCLLPYR
jgi:hypothetical protein